jgi:hypothetical protein
MRRPFHPQRKIVVKPPTKEKTPGYTEIKLPIAKFHLARLLEGGINPLIEMVTGGTLDLSIETSAWLFEERYATMIFIGLLSSIQIIKVPNLTGSEFTKRAEAIFGASTLDRCESLRATRLANPSLYRKMQRA